MEMESSSIGIRHKAQSFLFVGLQFCRSTAFAGGEEEEGGNASHNILKQFIVWPAEGEGLF